MTSEYGYALERDGVPDADQGVPPARDDHVAFWMVTEAGHGEQGVGDAGYFPAVIAVPNLRRKKQKHFNTWEIMKSRNSLCVTNERQNLLTIVHFLDF